MENLNKKLDWTRNTFNLFNLVVTDEVIKIFIPETFTTSF